MELFVPLKLTTCCGASKITNFNNKKCTKKINNSNAIKA